MPLWIYRALISGNYNREMQAGFRLAAKFKLSVVWGKLAPDLITAIHMAVDIFLVNSDVVYVLIGLENRQNMSETDSVAKRAWHWWLMLSWHYGGHCLYQKKRRRRRRRWKHGPLENAVGRFWWLRDVVLEGVECVCICEACSKRFQCERDSKRANLPLYYISPSFQFQSAALASSRDERSEEHSSRWGRHQHPLSPAPHQPQRVSRIIERLSAQMNSNAAATIRVRPGTPLIPTSKLQILFLINNSFSSSFCVHG